MNEKVIGKRFWFFSFIFLFIFLSIPVSGFFLNENAEQRGQWGDFFGGTLNPLLTFLTFVGLLFTIFLQQRELNLSRDELALTREELKRSSDALESQNESLVQQRFETTLFNMISLLNEIINSMDVKYPGSDTSYHGRDCFKFFESKLNDFYDYRSWNDDPVYEPGFGNDDMIEYPHDDERIMESYKLLYNRFNSDLGHYFRVLYNIFKFINQSSYKNPIYGKILRAQLSNQELLIIFYNCSSEYGRNFREPSSVFALFDNLNRADLIRPEHLSLVPEASLGAQAGLPNKVSE